MEHEQVNELTYDLQITERAKRFKEEPLFNLNQFITQGMLKDCFKQLNKKSAAGIDGKSWQDYALIVEDEIPELYEQFKSGRYRAPNIRRVYIPKDNKGGVRPLGLTTISDKILQRAVCNILDPLYETEFKDFSYGYRKGRSAHQAIDYMHKKVSYDKMYYIIDADIKNYFGSIDHGMLREFLDRRLSDGIIRKMIGKWLKAGVLENGQVNYPTEGTQQGGLISGILSNVFLHYVFDEWFVEGIQPLLKGKSFAVRYCDDLIIGFTNREDADRVMKVLPKRFEKYHLTQHPEKTKLINLKSERGRGERSFDFLGFTHYLGITRKGFPVLKRKTCRKKLSQSLTKMNTWIKVNRHLDIKVIIAAINLKLRGYYNYYGITFNSMSLMSYYRQTIRLLHKWLNRRGGKMKWNWVKFSQFIDLYHPLLNLKSV